MKGKIHIVHYNASEYHEHSKIWASLLKTLYDSCEKERPFWKRVEFGWFHMWSNFWEGIWREFPKYLLNALATFFTVSLLMKTYDLEFMNELSKNDMIGEFSSIKIVLEWLKNGGLLKGVLPVVVFIRNVIFPLIRNLSTVITPISKKVLSSFDIPDFNDDLGYRESIKRTLDDLLKVWARKEDEKIVLIIDDLDRCSEKTVVEFFYALQLFLYIDEVVVVLSVNKKSVCYALANDNKHYFEKEPSNKEKMVFGVDYLKKYIQIPIFLPNIEEYDDLVKSLFNKLDSGRIGYNLEKSNPSHNTIEVENQSVNVDTAFDVDSIIEKNVFSEFEEKMILEKINENNGLSSITPREVKTIINILHLCKNMVVLTNMNIYKNDEKNGKEVIVFIKLLDWFFFQYFMKSECNKLMSKLRIHELDKVEMSRRIDDLLEREVRKDEKYTKIKDLRLSEVSEIKKICDCFIFDIENLS